MILKEDKRYVTRNLGIVQITIGNRNELLGILIESKNSITKYNENGKSSHVSSRRKDIIEEITAKQSNHGIYSDFELSIIRAEDKIRTCTIHGVHAHMQLKIKEKKNRLNNCLRILQYL